MVWVLHLVDFGTLTRMGSGSPPEVMTELGRDPDAPSGHQSLQSRGTMERDLFCGGEEQIQQPIILLKYKWHENIIF